jgi:hypothetical protein
VSSMGDALQRPDYTRDGLARSRRSRLHLRKQREHERKYDDDCEDQEYPLRGRSPPGLA